MEFIIDPKIIELFPELKIGLLIAKNIQNKESNQEFKEEYKKLQEQIKTQLNIETLSNHPKILDWRNAYNKFGAKPKTYKNSVESLLRRVLKNKDNKPALPNINQIVDIYNHISIKHILPAGGDDLENIAGNITLTFSKEDKTFTILGKDTKENVPKGEVVYEDNQEILCRKWNWRECNKSKMTNETKNITIVLEALEHTTKEELTIALEELKQLISKYCGGKLKTKILDKENPREIL